MKLSKTAVLAPKTINLYKDPKEIEELSRIASLPLKERKTELTKFTLTYGRTYGGAYVKMREISIGKLMPSKRKAIMNSGNSTLAVGYSHITVDSDNKKLIFHMV